MKQRSHPAPNHRRVTPVVLAAVFAGLIVSVAGAAPRVVLGEYFTNLF